MSKTLVIANETIEGTAFYHIHGQGDAARLKVLASDAVAAPSQSMDLWVEVASSHLRRLVTREPDGTTGWRLDLSDHNRPAEITAP